ncbi:MAG: class I SAM-dependent methyltransferase [Anaerolineae bacterium]|nr:class I SAM-dependent methyltransferase [Anaerolineae bacterium]MDW8171603.1 methyltransferase domain-containing protein [Anaerolineae bacterium]
MLHYRTTLSYQNRAEKMAYVWDKYQPLLKGKAILDVGCDQRELTRYLDEQAHYWGIDIGGNPDQVVDLEAGPLPFADRAFDTVLCLDVLEHIETIHFIFDELCRVAREAIIISLPNAYADFYHMLQHRDYQPGQALKFYGLPPEKPQDRHKWFFSLDEAERFVRYRAEKNGWQVEQFDAIGHKANLVPDDWRERIARLLRYPRPYRLGFKTRNLTSSTLWTVLRR